MTATLAPAIALGIAAAVALTACSSSTTANTGPAGAGSAIAGPALPRGQAMSLADKVPGCTPHPLGSADKSTAGAVAIAAALKDASSAATCTLRGRTVVIIAFSDDHAQALADVELARADAYYATGAGWSAAPEALNAVSGEQSIVQDIALALNGLVRSGS